jgi:uncharacterized membrane protein
MALLILGLVLFLGVHSTRIFADGWRNSMIARLGPLQWKGLYALVSIIGFVVLIYGYKLAREETMVLWTSPGWMKHVTALLTMIAFVLFVSPYVPNNSFKARLHHPQVLSVKVWALAHLLATGIAAGVVLFGAFLVWAVLSFRSARQRDRAAGTVYPPGTAVGTSMAIAVGLVAWSVFALLLHGPLIGVRPLGY